MIRMEFNEVKELSSKYLFQNYGRIDLSFTHGKGCHLYDTAGNEYLDLVAGIAVNALGYAHPDWVEAVQAQVARMVHVSNLYHVEEQARLAEKIASITPGKLNRTLFVNSGAEANEGALKVAVRYTGRGKVLAALNGFHGRTAAALGATGQTKYQQSFEPLISNAFHYYEYGNCESVKSMIDKDTAAVIVEPIQGEGGVVPAPVEFLQAVRRITRELGIPMICDEIQCGMGRSGKVFAFEYADIVPDVILISKAIGGGQPLSVVVYDKALDLWGPGAHAGTFRGNQVAMAAGTVVMKRISDPEFLKEVVRKGEKMRSRFLKLKEEVSIIGDVRGKGLMLGVEFIDPNGPKDIMGNPEPGGEVALKVQRLCFENKLIMEKGGRNGSVMRCLCPLTITDEQIDEAMDIFEKVVKEVDADVRG